MADNLSTVENAARLIYKSLHTGLSPVNDAQYRQLLDTYRADPQFAATVLEVATGFELAILDFSDRGIVVAPASRESRFALRIADLRMNLKPEQKAALVLAHVAIASVFFPTTDGLEDENYIAPPANTAQFRDALHAFSRRLKDTEELPLDMPAELVPGWELVCALPSTIPNAQRATPSSVTGLVSLALSQMVTAGLARVDREASDESLVTYTPTHRLRVQLRELTLRRLFEIAQASIDKPGTSL
ncbi:conserved hypothetical protein [Cupriavidus taiwanensis]|uniref:Uncharacterized protein n=1 Tax=Cupriavidus taiwanensis TaxID=164546 RepID=A0A375EA73_9BURK|nr:hypothetical protein [Cupriavidus taiwanensis]SOZ68593.1 conserved hypothetical protein [Cupriavidus taiwanensis]SOZ69745.1 conserved hypothetical protein [Cupriavidus taiwanensis]SOZ72937.1 conserved hypothetical protein [Cupriavidus taiwanensis]SPA09846.1 conserved hypothetical protein [Cupriavidus taiwanensis]SPA23806.1 conserved hypothetical protein [Cupriavidus taiwanensis]